VLVSAFCRNDLPKVRDTMSRAIGIIPARWGSTRFPGKPLHLIAGKQLLRRVWERAGKAKTLDAVIIATDDIRIAKAAFEWGAEISFTSPTHASGTDRIAEVALKMKRAEFVVNIQGDEPLIDPRLIDRLLKKLQANPKIDIVTAAHPFEKSNDMSSPNQVKAFVAPDGRAMDFSRSASRSGGVLDRRLNQKRASARPLKLRVLRHQGIYAFRRSALMKFVKLKRSPREIAESLEQLRALENGVTVHVLVTKHGSPGVDTPRDAQNVASALRSVKASAGRSLPRKRGKRR
jgi:3-deoxy-manno-octulosonate cytidylyltransferase (CMP-KDO synthetase)